MRYGHVVDGVEVSRREHQAENPPCVAPNGHFWYRWHPYGDDMAEHHEGDPMYRRDCSIMGCTAYETAVDLVPAPERSMVRKP